MAAPSPQDAATLATVAGAITPSPSIRTGSSALGSPVRGEQLIGLRGAGLEPLEGLRGAGEEVAQVVIGALQPPADDLDLGPNRAHQRARRNISWSS